MQSALAASADICRVLKIDKFGDILMVDSNFNMNTPDPGPGSPASRRPLRNTASNVVNVTYGDTTGVGNYHSFQVAVGRRFHNGLAWLGAYTYSPLHR